MILGKYLIRRINLSLKLSILTILTLINFSESLLHCKCNDHNQCLINNQNKFSNESKFYCVIKEKGHCFAARVVESSNQLEPDNTKIVQRYGCLSTDTKSILSCNGHYFNSTKPVAIDCCNKTAFCNSRLHPKFFHHNSDKDAIDYAVNNRKNSKITPKSSYKGLNTTIGTIMMTVCAVVLIICMSVCVAVVCYCRKKLHWASKHVLGQSGTSQMRSGQESALLPVHPPPHSQTATSGSLMTASSLLTTTTTNASHHRLTQRTLGHQILFTGIIGKGRFSEVLAGDWLGEIVAVKRLHQSSHSKMLHETLWLRTIGLYYSYPVQHNYVTSLLGSDKIPTDVVTPCPSTLVLIYPYYQWGTLARLMASSHWDLSPSSPQSMEPNSRLETLSRMALSLVSGLCYLHTEIAATKGKPAIAHRNLKSSNIYVKDDYSCCIGDLEWAFVGGVRDDDRCNLESQILPQLTSPNGLVQLPDFEYCVSSVLLSTDCRYVAPELLNGTENSNSSSHSLKSVEDYKKSDIYSLSLILWELLVWFEPKLKQTAHSSSSCDQPAAAVWNYEPAYQAELVQLRESMSYDVARIHEDPLLAEMQRLVLTQSVRPNLAVQKSSPGVIELLCQIIPQCWSSFSDTRLSCLKVKKCLSQLDESTSQSVPS